MSSKKIAQTIHPAPVLIGMRGSGKSRVAKELAIRINLPMVDADREMEIRFKQPIEQLFAEHGEPWFREQEEKLLLRLLEQSDKIIATGGGAVLHETVRTALSTRPTIWLKAPVSVLARRIHRSSRPRLIPTAKSLEAELRQLLQQREALYAAAASKEIDAGNRAIDEIVEEVAAYWHGLDQPD